MFIVTCGDQDGLSMREKQFEHYVIHMQYIFVRD